MIRVRAAVLLIVFFSGCGAKSPVAKEDILFPPSMAQGTVDVGAALDIAKLAVETNDADAKIIKLEASPETVGWGVLVELKRGDRDEYRSIHIDDRGAVIRYGRGK